jgi:RecA-family ATPase
MSVPLDEFHEQHPGLRPIASADATDGGARFVSLAGMKPRPVRWLWEDRLPRGFLSLIAGVPGQGKTGVGLERGARVTKGELEGDLFGKPSGFVIMSREDTLDEVIVPRLVAADADMAHVFALPMTGDKFSIEDDLPELERLIAAEDVGLVFLDPVLAFMRGKTYEDAKVREALSPIQAMAATHRVSVVAVMHLNKDVMKDLLSRITDSGAFTALVRSILFVGADPDDEDERNPARLLAHGKSNYGPIKPSLAFRIEETWVDGEDEDGQPIKVRTSRLEFTGESEITAEQMVKGRASDGSKIQRAEALLRRLCPAAKTLVLEAGDAEKISESTISRAFRRLGGTADEQSHGEDGRMQSVMWRLPASDRYGANRV